MGAIMGKACEKKKKPIGEAQPASREAAVKAGYSAEEIDEMGGLEPEGMCDCSKAPIFKKPIMAWMMMPVMRRPGPHKGAP